MARVIRAVGPLQIRDPLDDSFSALVRSITYQQLARAAAAAIHGRFLKLFTGTLLSRIGRNPAKVIVRKPAEVIV